MKEIELTEKTQREHKDYAPVELSENVTVESTREVNENGCVVEGAISRSGKNIGRFVYNEEQGRIFVNVSTDDIKRGTRVEILETVAAIVAKLVPEEAE